MTIEEYIQALDWEKEPKGLYEPIGYTLEAGGKRLRPTLAIIACEMMGGCKEDAIHAALALEIFHNFTLLHDDVMDKAEVRRGRPTVHVRWNANTAILSGDQMVIEAYKQLGQLPAEKLPRALGLFNQMATEICEGQQMDIDFETRSEVTLEEYMEMIRKKTSVLLATALQIGGYLAGASESDQQHLYRYGIHLGLAFQIQDDILDCYGDPETFGKAVGGDITDNKKTCMLLTALERAEGINKERLQTWLLETQRSEEKIEGVKRIYDELGVREACEQMMLHHTQEALRELNALPHNTACEQLQALAEQLAHRQK